MNTAEWIPVDQSLPSLHFLNSFQEDTPPHLTYEFYESEPILAALERGEYAIARLTSSVINGETEDVTWWVESNRVENGEDIEKYSVLAWMPLPPHYLESQQESETVHNSQTIIRAEESFPLS